MAFDPLSKSTRSKQTSLVMLCGASILSSVYSLELDPKALPISGEVPSDVIQVILVCSIFYLAITYFVQLRDDLKSTPDNAMAIQMSVLRERSAEPYQKAAVGLGKLMANENITNRDVAVYMSSEGFAILADNYSWDGDSDKFPHRVGNVLRASDEPFDDLDWFDELQDEVRRYAKIYQIDSYNRVWSDAKSWGLWTLNVYAILLILFVTVLGWTGMLDRFSAP